MNIYCINKYYRIFYVFNMKIKNMSFYKMIDFFCFCSLVQIVIFGILGFVQEIVFKIVYFY